MNRWTLTDEVKEKYTPIILDFINQVETVDREAATELLEIDFSDTELRPYTLWQILENLGYDDHDQDDNGWEMDFWLTFRKEGFRPIQIKGCGMTFELILSEYDD
jgi:hypothetical protein